MRLEDVDQVKTLRDQRAKALGLRNAARGGSVGDLTLWHEGASFDVWSIISAEPVRSAIIVAAEQFIVETDKKLAKLGVQTDRIDETPATIDDWKRSAEMFSRAWLRELGGKLIPKSHFIDALVLTTRQMKERADRAPQSAD